MIPVFMENIYKAVNKKTFANATNKMSDKEQNKLIRIAKKPFTPETKKEIQDYLFPFAIDKEELKRRKIPLKKLQEKKALGEVVTKEEIKKATKIAKSKGFEETKVPKETKPLTTRPIQAIITLGITVILSLVLIPTLGLKRGFFTAFAISICGYNFVSFSGWWYKNHNGFEKNRNSTIIAYTGIIIAMIYIATTSDMVSALWAVGWMLVFIAIFFIFSNILVKIELIAILFTIMLIIVWDQNAVAEKIALCKHIPPMGIIFDKVRSALESKAHLYVGLGYMIFQRYIFNEYIESGHLSLG